MRKASEHIILRRKRKIFGVYKLLLFSGLFLLFGCNIPQDCGNSFSTAKNLGLKVGVVNNPPYSEREGSRISGTEIELVKEFAASHQLQVKYFSGSESQLIKLLEERNLHIVLGGFDKKTLWKEKAGLTAPYDETHVFLIPKGENKLVYELENFFQKGK